MNEPTAYKKEPLMKLNLSVTGGPWQTTESFRQKLFDKKRLSLKNL